MKNFSIRLDEVLKRDVIDTTALARNLLADVKPSDIIRQAVKEGLPLLRQRFAQKKSK